MQDISAPIYMRHVLIDELHKEVPLKGSLDVRSLISFLGSHNGRIGDPQPSSLGESPERITIECH